MWSFVICDSLTGARQLAVSPSGGSWRTGVNANVGTGEHSFQLRDRGGLSPAVWRGLVRPWARTLVVCWDGDPVYAGLISGHEYDRDTGVLNVSHQEFRAVLSRRLVSSGVSYSAASAFEVTAKSLRGMARAIVARYTIRNPGDGFTFPVVLPSDEAGGESRRWPFYEFATAEDMLAEIQDTDGGPDVYFRPRWSSSGSLEWVIEVGSPALSGPTVEWVLGAQESPAIGVRQVTDARATLTGVVGIGKGTEQDMVLGFAGALGSFPVWLDATRSFKSVDVAAQLDALALGELRAVEQPTRQLRVSSAPARFAFPGARVGATVRLLVSGDHFIEDGTHVQRVIGLAGDMGSTIRLETQ